MSRRNHGLSSTGRPSLNARKYRPRSPSQIPAKLLMAAHEGETMLFTASRAAPSTATSSNTNVRPKIASACAKSEVDMPDITRPRQTWLPDIEASTETLQTPDQERFRAGAE